VVCLVAGHQHCHDRHRAPCLVCAQRLGEQPLLGVGAGFGTEAHGECACVRKGVLHPQLPVPGDGPRRGFGPDAQALRGERGLERGGGLALARGEAE